MEAAWHSAMTVLGTNVRSPTKIAMGAACTAVAAVVALAVYFYWFTIPGPVWTYYGVLLDSDTKAEIAHKLGVPDQVYSEPQVSGEFKGWEHVYQLNPREGKPGTLPRGKEFTNYNAWGYNLPGRDSRLEVRFRKASPGNVSRVECVSLSTTSGACKPLLGMNVGDDEAELVRRLGPPTGAFLYTGASSLGMVKTIVYQNLNATYLLEKQRIYSMAIGHWVRGKDQQR